MALDNCPTCDRRIADYDANGCEFPTGQRYCLNHLPAEAPPCCDAIGEAIRFGFLEVVAGEVVLPRRKITDLDPDATARNADTGETYDAGDFQLTWAVAFCPFCSSDLADLAALNDFRAGRRPTEDAADISTWPPDAGERDCLCEDTGLDPACPIHGREATGERDAGRPALLDAAAYAPIYDDPEEYAAP